MALRTMAAKLSQKVSSSVMRVAKFSRARAKTSSPFDGLKNVDPGFRRDLEELLMLHRKMDRDTNIAQATGAGLGLATLIYMINKSIAEVGRQGRQAVASMDP